MAEFFEFDPITGITTDTAWDESTQEMTLIRSADVEPVLDYSKHMAGERSAWQQGVKQSMALYAKLPPIVVLQMRAKGIDVFDQNCGSAMLAEINTSYPHLKCTTAVEGGKAKLIV